MKFTGFFVFAFFLVGALTIPNAFADDVIPSWIKNNADWWADDKIAIVTGRGFNAINSSLKEILNQFNVENSVFLEDEARDLAKPNPQSLIRAMNGLNSKNCLYVGDSMEDMILAQKASELGFQATFCGIYGSGKLPEMKKKLFTEHEVPLIVETINQLPDILMIKKA